MSDRSYVEVAFGPVRGEALAQVEAFIGKDGCEGLGLDLAAVDEEGIDFDLYSVETTADGGIFSFHAIEMTSGTSNGELVDLLAQLRDLGISYDAHDGGCVGAWDPDLTWWRPGMDESKQTLEADMGGAVVAVHDLERVLADHPAALAAIQAELAVPVPPLSA